MGDLVESLKRWSRFGYGVGVTADLIEAARTLTRLQAEREQARRIITEIDDYMKRPERGDWGVECALCMGELLDDDRDTIARIDATLATLKDRQP